jgi:ParB family transcriptional regulator, chromosome partitioning protein
MVKRKLLLQNNPLTAGSAYSEREKGGVPYKEILLSAIDRDLNQPRVNFDEEKLNELAASITRYGVLTPILVRPSKLPGKFVIIAGERRFRAAKIAQLSSIPAIIDSDDDDDGDKTLAKQIVENVQRADLTPLERAHAIGAMRDAHSLSVRDVAERLGVSKSMVQRSMELLELPDDLLNALRQGVSESKVLLLSKVSDEVARARLLKDIDGTTRDELQSLLRDDSEAKDKGNKKSAKAGSVEQKLSAEDKRIVDEMQRALGLRVGIQKSSSQTDKGKVMIDFYGAEDLQLIFRRLVSEE